MSQSYTIRSGDNLGAIARRFNTTVDRIAQANHIADPNRIYAGQTLTIPDGFDAPKPVSNSGGGSGSYTVQSGDTLSGIAGRFGTTVGAIASANGISDPNRISVGQRLTIPGGGSTQGTSAPSAPSGAARSYTVQSGDTLSGIAGRFGTTVGAIASANGISDPNRINVGQRLTIPGSGGTQAPSTPSAPSGGSRSYTVQAGDTLSGIAGRFGTTVGAIASANGISDPNRINVGQRLTIPGGGGSTQGPSAPSAPSGGSRTYTVQPGDTLSGIASRYGTTVGAIASANGISNPNLINVGQRLTIPGGDGFDPGPVSGPGPVTGPVPGNGKGGVSLQQLRAIMPTLPEARAQQLLPYLNSAMAEAQINTPKRQAAFLAQLAHESVQLRYFEEIASGAAYEGRRDLGNIYPGDGVRYKGRGPIQLTGRSNYRAAGQALGIDLENNPTRAADPDVGFRTAAWFWTSRNLNSYADAGNFDAITLRVNGGYNGKASRDAYYATALRVLGA